MKAKMTRKISAILLAGCSFLALPAAQAYEAGDWIIRAGPAGVYPTGEGKIKGIDGSKVEADSAWSLGANFTYMATKHIDSGPLGVDALDHFRITALRLAARTSTHQYRLGIR